ncbi:MAG: protein BatD [Gemmatimonadetes bacterium]|nr:protein BatD [Gemmatimonadota bacterium]
MNINGMACGLRRLAVLTLFPILVPPAAAVAQTPTARIQVDPPEITVGETLRLVLEISGVREIEQVARPWLPGLRRPGLPFETAVGVRVGGGEPEVAESSFRLFFELVPDAAGPYEVGPFRITADGRTLETEPVTVRVIPREAEAATVVAWLEDERVRVGDRFRLSAEILGSSFAEHEFILPDVFDFAESGGGSSGAFERTWHLRALVPGEFVIPPIRVTGPGGSYESEPLTVVIDPQPVEVEATVEAGSIWVGGEFMFRLEVTGVGELDQEPILPETGAFAELVALEDSRESPPGIVGGSTVERVYRLRALRPGRFEIGPVRIAAAGRTLATDPINIVVDQAPTLEEDAPASLILMGSPEKTRVHVNEPVVVSYTLAHDRLAEGLGPRPGTRSWPSFDGFRVLERQRWGGWEDLVVDGRTFGQNTIRRVSLLPLEPGLLSVDRGMVEARRIDRSAGWDRATGRPRMASIVLASEPFTLEVLPLPDEGRPASFQGHVGTVAVASRVDRTRVPVGETLTLVVEVSVEGHLETLPDPEIEFPNGFAVSEPEVDTNPLERRGVLSGSRTYTYRLTAVTSGTYRIPAVEMSWFDAGTESYGTSRSHPFTITVVPAGSEGR